jgi:tetratricopeptide (TPR) repeat protein
MGESTEDLAAQGKRAYQSGNYQNAVALFLKAEQGFKSDGKPLMVAEMANNRSVALLQAGDAKGALAACQDTDKVFASAGDTLREGLALGNQASALKELGQKKESLKIFRLSAARLKKAGDKENLAIVHKTIAALEMGMGDNLGAMSSMLDAMQSTKKLTWREKFMRWLFSLVSRLLPK